MVNYDKFLKAFSKENDKYLYVWEDEKILNNYNKICRVRKYYLSLKYWIC